MAFLVTSETLSNLVQETVPPYVSHGIFHGIFDELLGGGLLGTLASIALGTMVIAGFASGLPAFWTWAERRIAGMIQQRPGPNRVGPFGLLQAIADGVKLLFKEDIIPANASRLLFMLAPGIVLAGTFGTFAMLPLSPNGIVVTAPLGIYIIVSLMALEVIGVIMAGWASNNKWSILGAMREAAQMVSYEVPMGLCILLVVLATGHLDLQGVVQEQEGGFLHVGNWMIFRSGPMLFPWGLVAFVVFYISLLANTKRAPFDLPEAESELVSGYHTEYSGMRFSFFFLAEYAAMFLVSGLAVCMFLGGWNLPFVPATFFRENGMIGELLACAVMILKSFFLVFVMVWLRWTLPRIRVDQVMGLCYKYLTPIAFVCLVAAILTEGLAEGSS